VDIINVGTTIIVGLTTTPITTTTHHCAETAMGESVVILVTTKCRTPTDLG
jgi:hypothetical protein